MVKNPRKATGAGPIRALNLPGPAEVEEDEGHRPVGLTLRRRRLGVVSIEDRWEIADEWWRTRPVARAYYRVLLEGGESAVVFRDLLDGAWYHHRG